MQLKFRVILKGYNSLLWYRSNVWRLELHGYSRWNLEQKAFQEVTKVTESGGVYGLDADIPTYINQRSTLSL